MISAQEVTVLLLGKKWSSVFALAIPVLFGAASPVLSDPIQGAGSTFAAPIVAKWAKNYQMARTDGGEFTSPDWNVDYEPVGSFAGLMRLRQPELDFAATDVPLPPEEIAKRGYQQFPIVMGGVAIVVNLEGVASGALKLSGPVLAEIYSGKVQNWSDAAIKTLNPDLKLPDQRIEVLHRKDGSGTTFVFTEFLSGASADWKAKYGADQLISWPLGRSVERSQGIIRAVAATRGAIGYVEYGQVHRAGLSMATVRNRAGEFVMPDPAGVQAAAKSVEWVGARHFSVQLTDQPGAGAYPITAATFVVMPFAGQAKNRYGRVHDLFRLAFDTGAGDASGLGYVPLPQPLVEQIKKYWVGGAKAGG
jgi:phosphate transport system substrate-binding protein